MGLEPTTSAVTGRRSNQLSHQAKTLLLQRCGTKLFLQNCILKISIIHFFVSLSLKITLLYVLSYDHCLYFVKPLQVA